MTLKINLPSPYLTVTKSVNGDHVSIHVGSAETGPIAELILDNLSPPDAIECRCNDFEYLHIPSLTATEVDYLNDNGADCR